MSESEIRHGTGHPEVKTTATWEWSTPEQMQLLLAGYQSRQDYLNDRRQRAGWIAERLRLSPEHHVLDLGSGEGLVASLLAPKVTTVTCADISHSFLEEAQRTCREHRNVRYHLIRGDFLDGIATGTVDAGYSLNVFIHLDEYQIFLYLEGVRRVLRESGRFFFNFTDLGRVTLPFFRRDAARYRSSSPEEFKGFMRWHNRDLICALAREAGLTAEPDGFTDEEGVGYLLLCRRG